MTMTMEVWELKAYTDPPYAGREQSCQGYHKNGKGIRSLLVDLAYCIWASIWVYVRAHVGAVGGLRLGFRVCMWVQTPQLSLQICTPSVFGIHVRPGPESTVSCLFDPNCRNPCP